MRTIPTEIPDVVIIEPSVFGDERGFLFESYNESVFHDLIGGAPHFVQDNHSRSTRNVLRGLHYQVEQPQAKLVRVAVGEVFDVAVDVRRTSATFGKWVGVLLSAENKRQMWYRPALRMGFWCCLKLPNSSTRLPTTTHRSMNAGLSGTIRRLPSDGRFASVAQSYPAKMPMQVCFAMSCNDK